MIFAFVKSTWHQKRVSSGAITNFNFTFFDALVLDAEVLLPGTSAFYSDSQQASQRARF